MLHVKISQFTKYQYCKGKMEFFNGRNFKIYNWSSSKEKNIIYLILNKYHLTLKHYKSGIISQFCKYFATSGFQSDPHNCGLLPKQWDPCSMMYTELIHGIIHLIKVDLSNLILYQKSL